LKVKRIAHVAIAQEGPKAAHTLLTELLGIPYMGNDRVDREGVDTHFFEVGESALEILEPLGADTPVGKYLAKRGPGLHHIALEVEGLDAFVAHLKAAGIRLLSDEPTLGAHGKRIIFIHPKSAGGVLLELCEEVEGRK